MTSTIFEPVYMSDPDYDRIAKIVYASYPDGCILMIDRIENPSLTERYEARRTAMGFDSFVDNPKRPSIYVIPEDQRTFPEFLVRYHKTTG